MRLAKHVSHKEETRNACKIMVGNTEAKRQLGKVRHGWDDNIKMYFRN
jgi:hypothetical protein